MRKGTWFAYGKPYGKGDTVGLLVEMPLEDSSDVSSAESLSAPSSSASLTSASDPPTETDSALGLFSRGAPPGAARVTFFVNGESQGAVPLDMDMRQMDAEKDEDPPQLHATVCLYRPNSMVSMRCCAADWEYFPSASAVCSQLRATCQKRNSRTRVPRGSSERIVIEKGTKRAEGEQGAYSHCASVLTP